MPEFISLTRGKVKKEEIAAYWLPDPDYPEQKVYVTIRCGKIFQTKYETLQQFEDAYHGRYRGEDK